jgi:hypothetical protein
LGLGIKPAVFSSGESKNAISSKSMGRGGSHVTDGPDRNHGENHGNFYGPYPENLARRGRFEITSTSISASGRSAFGKAPQSLMELQTM